MQSCPIHHELMNDHRRRNSVSNMLGRLAWEPLQERRAMVQLTTMKKILLRQGGNKL